MAPKLKKAGAAPSASAKKKQVDPRRELRRVRAEAAAGRRGPKHKFDLWRSRKQERLTKAQSLKPTPIDAAGTLKVEQLVKAVSKSQRPAQPLVETKERRLGELRKEAQKRRLYHDVRTLRQTMKKAKQLELRKAIRKWTGERAKHEGADVAEVDKYHRQVTAIKAADLTVLVARALDKVGLRKLASETGALAASDSTNDELMAPCTRLQAKEDNDAAARLLGAKCVRVLLQQLVDTHSSTNSAHTHKTVASNKQQHNTDAKQQSRDNVVDEVDIETKAASARALSKLLAAKRKNTKLDQKPHALSEDDSLLASASESDEEEGIDYPMRDSSEDEGGDDELVPERSDDEEEEEQEGSDVTQEEGEPSQFANTLRTEANGKSKGDSKAKPKVKPKVKKRLGQRARRRLAELQYGPAARHVQVQQHKAVQPPSRVVALVSPNAAKRKPHNISTAAVQRKPQAAALMLTLPEKRDEREEALHPSWAAKRKLAEAMAAGGKGKKIKFDDDNI